MQFGNRAQDKSNDRAACMDPNVMRKLGIYAREMVRGLTDVHEPTKTDGMNEAAIPKALKPQGEREATPSTDTVPGSLPEEDGDPASRNARNTA